MLLAIDTSGREGGIALANYDGEFAIIRGEAEISGGTFSAELVPQIAALLQSVAPAPPPTTNQILRHLTAIAVITGPGSFTGLRIGLAAIKGICEVMQLPVVPVSMLELIAAASGAQEVTTLLDAARREAYVGRFRNDDGVYATLSEELVPLESLQVEGLALTPDAAIARATGAIEVPRPKPSDLALYAVRKLARGLTITADALDAHYIRRSDAEIFSKPVFGA
jgi:tRNA threonylcarbamoyladenosine biosynthesis protein TsaB